MAHYQSYHPLSSLKNVVPVACWSTARRFFWEAIRADQGKAQCSLSYEGLRLIQDLYMIEEDLKNQSLEERGAVRKVKTAAQLIKIKDWVDRSLCTPLIQSPTAKALDYLSKNWEGLIAYRNDPRLNIDNEFVENRARPFELAAKNWIFSNTTSNAHTSIVIYSLIETAIANGHDPHNYLKYVLEHLPTAQNTRNLLPTVLEPEGPNYPI